MFEGWRIFDLVTIALIAVCAAMVLWAGFYEASIDGYWMKDEKKKDDA